MRSFNILVIVCMKTLLSKIRSAEYLKRHYLTSLMLYLQCRYNTSDVISWRFTLYSAPQYLALSIPHWTNEVRPIARSWSWIMGHLLLIQCLIGSKFYISHCCTVCHVTRQYIATTSSVSHRILHCVVLCFVGVQLIFDSLYLFIYILLGCITGTKTIIQLIQGQWNNLEWMNEIEW